VKQHSYEIEIAWTGDLGSGTRAYAAYSRNHEIRAKGKPVIPGSSDPHFRGDAARYNPEEMLVASLSACHMLWYLHLCATNRVVVTRYHDTAQGTMQERADGSGVFVEVILRPEVIVTAESDVTRAEALHADAHRMCFIANSVNFPVKHAPNVSRAPAQAASKP
jgi:organic hydroperoxide reductase OsmC/OhrA